MATLSASIAVGLALHPVHASAQSPSLTPGEISQVVDEVLSTIIPPDSSLSRVPIRDRGLFFDYGTTLAAFGYHDTANAASRLSLKSSVMPGTRSLLDGCRQIVPLPCQPLGWGAYVSLGLVSRSDSEMVVRLNVHWADRGAIPYRRADAPSGRAYLTSFRLEVHLRCAADGNWRFARTGRTMVSD